MPKTAPSFPLAFASESEMLRLSNNLPILPIIMIAIESESCVNDVRCPKYLLIIVSYRREKLNLDRKLLEPPSRALREEMILVKGVISCCDHQRAKWGKGIMCTLQSDIFKQITYS